jgi:hypothetical protein
MEKSMRLAMIVAKSVDAKARKVMPVHLEWAIQYVRHYDLELIRAVRRERVENQTDADIKKAIKYIKAAKKYSKDARFGNICSQGGMPHSKLLKLMAMTARQFKELMDTAAESGAVGRSPGIDLGYAGDVYFPVDE